MAGARKINVVMTFIILSIAWTIVVVPISLLLRIIGKKVMDMSYDLSAQSYWETRDEKLNDFKHLERQF